MSAVLAASPGSAACAAVEASRSSRTIAGVYSRPMPARGRAALIVIGLAATIGAAAQTRIPAASRAFAVGVLRRDGIVVPFADFDGKRWHASWPEPKGRVDVPIHVRDVPSGWWGKAGPLDTWEVWVGADPPRMVHVRQPEWLDAHCFRQIGLRTDYRSAQPAPGPDVQPYPKDGLA